VHYLSARYYPLEPGSSVRIARERTGALIIPSASKPSCRVQHHIFRDEYGFQAIQVVQPDTAILVVSHANQQSLTIGPSAHCWPAWPHRRGPTRLPEVLANSIVDLLSVYPTPSAARRIPRGIFELSLGISGISRLKCYDHFSEFARAQFC